MIVKILSSTGTFSGVKYNTDKVSKETGELMKVQNMPHVDPLNMTERECKDYFIAHSSMNKNIKHSQFHAVISAKGQELDKYQLTEIAEKYMAQMGYGDNPFIVVFHKDTDNNHVHIVSSRVGNDGRKIDHNHEGRRSRSILNSLEKEYNVVRDKDYLPFLKYNFESKNQFITLLKSQGFEVNEKDDVINILYGGQKKGYIADKDLVFNETDRVRATQLKAIISKYSTEYNTELQPIFKKLKGDRIGNDVVGYTSELSEVLKAKFGIEFIYHYSGEKKPFGYSILDHSKKNVFKGSDIMKLSLLINEQKDKKQKEIQKNRNKLLNKINTYNISSLKHIQVLAKYYKVDEYKISLNEHKISDADLTYYRVLLDHHFSHDNWANLNKLQIVPLLHDGELLLLDKSSLLIIEAKDCLDRDILESYLEVAEYSNSFDYDQNENFDFEIGWEVGDDEDDEMVHGRKRKGKKLK